MRTDEIKSLQV